MAGWFLDRIQLCHLRLALSLIDFWIFLIPGFAGSSLVWSIWKFMISFCFLLMLRNKIKRPLRYLVVFMYFKVRYSVFRYFKVRYFEEEIIDFLMATYSHENDMLAIALRSLPLRSLTEPASYYSSLEISKQPFFLYSMEA